MHRFRKKSDVKPPSISSFTSQNTSDRHAEASTLATSAPDVALPELPSTSDFRTSLILPDLSRRFSLLRNSQGDLPPWEDLKTKFADQRARGAPHQISEEEEDMLLDTLGKLRNKSDTESTRSQSESPNKGFMARRYNNLFSASSNFRDNNYIRSVTSQRSTQSITDSTKSNSTYSESLRPVTPEESSIISSVQSSPVPSKSTSEQGSPISMAEYRLAKALGPNGIKRASLALQQAMKEIEEEVEEEILMPRRPASRMNHDTKDTNGQVSRVSSVYEAGTAISADIPISQEDSPRASPSPVPTQTNSGYIPGMPRPMTPHTSIDLDEQRSHSTTPRATSPASSPFKRDSANPPRSPPAGSSFFISRSANGRFTPESSGRDVYSADLESTDGGSVFGRRRPASPLATNGFQSMTTNSSSRPSTPSNVIWNPNPATTTTKHSRDGSWISDFTSTSADADLASGVERSMSAARSLRSPALPDSPLMEGVDSGGVYKAFSMDIRPISPLSPNEMGSQAQVPLSRLLRSPTPTQDQRSPTSSSFPQPISTPEKRNHSRQNSYTLPQFNFGSLNTIAFSPTANSSRSSLESEGSSYHSWEGEDRRNRPPSIFDEADPNRQPWHALASLDKSSTSQTSIDELSQAEETLKQFAGLTKEDIAIIQTKLAADAMNRLHTQRERANSLRKRRPSTSQSNYPSPSRVASPPPRSAPSPSPLQSSVMEIQPIASVVNASPSVPAASTPPRIMSPPPIELTPSQRTRELAKALFGSEDEGSDQPTDSETPEQDDAQTVGHSAPVEALSPPTPTSPDPLPLPSSPEKKPSPEPSSVLEDMAARAKLTMEVQRRTAEANARYASSHAHKKVALHQISSPTMVASSTSVNTIPLPYSPSPVPNSSSPFSPPGTPLPTSSPATTSAPTSSKFGSRIKRLRGTLRSKQVPTGDEVTPFPFGSGPTPIHTADANKLHPMSANVPMSALESKRSKEPVPSPPASAGPGLRGFMARLRGKQRASENAQRSQSPQTSTNGSISASTPQLSSSSISEQPPSSRGPFQRQPISPQLLRLGAISPISPLSSPTTGEFSDIKSNSSIGEEDALQKFRDAAATIGLDDKDINDILIRKASVSSKGVNNWATVSRNNTVTSSTIPERKVESPTPDTPSTPTMRKMSIKDKKRETRSGSNAVVRRTIIFPSDSRMSTMDLNNLVSRKSISSRKKRSSVQSNRSIQDRVPTPPPPRGSTSKRFSNDASPPVPQLPQSISAHSQGSPNVDDNSHDSFYDMYSSESGNPEIRVNGGAGDQMGPALEVVELANGETIWQIINGLRDDDTESQYRRSSFDSEYSTRDGMQVYFKERRGSTTSSIAPRKKNVVRPETKVFYSSAAHIGKLIENLSSGLEAGSFNFQQVSPTKSMSTTGTSSHSLSIASSLSETDSQWTVEDRIEHMMGAVSSSTR